MSFKAKNSKWQRELERADSQLRPWRRGLYRFDVRDMELPLYVQRWLLLSSFDGSNGYSPAQKAERLLTEACLAAYRDAPLPPFKLNGAVSVEPADSAPEVLEDLADLAGTGVCVFNGSFAWLFAADRDTDRKRFSAWVKEASPCRRPSGWVGKAGR